MRLGVFVILFLSSEFMDEPMLLGESLFLANIQESLALNTQISLKRFAKKIC